MITKIQYGYIPRYSWGRLLLVCILVGSASSAYAQESMTLTVTPPLIQINLKPGETWASGIQVVNGNQYDMTVYAEPMLFEPAGEEGRPRFKNPPGMDNDTSIPDPTTLAGWITLPQGPLDIVREQTITVPLVITVPPDAAPGGHYAAVLIGNRAPQGSPNENSVSVTSAIASLIFLRVAGEVVEDGRIRDFVTEKSVYETPEAQLSLRFENQGNVHLQPRGDITIYNMFGKKRGMIPINQSGDYGNVMPGSVRKFTYTWKADAGTWDIGRYRAEATLGYGGDTKSFAQSTVYFYVLPLIPLAEMVLGALFFLWFVGWALRSYVRRAIAIESKHVEQESVTDTSVLRTHTQSFSAGGVRTVLESTHAPTAPSLVKPKLTLTSLIKPIQVGIVDLRSAAAPATFQAEHQTVPNMSVRTPSTRLGIRSFLYHYRLFFFFLTVIALSWVIASALLSDVLTYERPYEFKAVSEEEAAQLLQ
jgi:hypothetical protein